MKKYRIHTIIAIVFVIFVSFGFVSLLHAQETSVPPPEQPRQLSDQELRELRNTILDLWGIPHDTPMSIFDIMKGNPLGIDLPTMLGPLNSLQIAVDKKTLRPGEKMQAILTSLSIDLQKTNVTWYHNGKKVASGRGVVIYPFTLGQLGSAETIRAAVTTTKGDFREVTKVVRPAKIHFTWSTDSYTPNWYRGKKLPIPGSLITIMALPDARIGNTAISPSLLNYKWSVDGRSSQNRSGADAHIFKLHMSPSASTYTIRLGISDDQNRIAHEESITINASSEELLFYTISSLRGIDTSRTRSVWNTTAGNAFTVQLEPYFIPKNILADMTYEWVVNGERLMGIDPKNRALKIFTQENNSGMQNIKVSLKNIGGNPYISSMETSLQVNQKR